MLKLKRSNAATSQSYWVHQQDKLILHCDNFPLQQEFILIWQNCANNRGLKITEIAEGAERLQIYFSHGQSRFILCFEATCEAIWIETWGSQPAMSFESLLNALDWS